MRVITVARKPLSEVNVASNTIKHGTGALNIDGCRVRFASIVDSQQHAKEWDREYNPETNSSPIHTWDKAIGNHPGMKRTSGGGENKQKGRWPANLILEHLSGCLRTGASWECLQGCPVVELGRQTEERPAGTAVMKNRDGECPNQIYGARRCPSGADVSYGDTGTAARFFKQVKS